MFEFRHVLVRMRQGDSDRDLARAGLVGRRKAQELRRLARARGWLSPDTPMPDDAVLAEALTRPERPGPVSCVEPFRELVASWAEQGIQSKTIHQALVRLHQFHGSYASVNRFVRALALEAPQATVHLDFARRVIIDNAKCAITRACIRDPEVQRAYAECAECAEGYGFKITACDPRDPQKKGRVESSVKYVKRNFLPLRYFRDLPDKSFAFH